MKTVTAVALCLAAFTNAARAQEPTELKEPKPTPAQVGVIAMHHILATEARLKRDGGRFVALPQLIDSRRFHQAPDMLDGYLTFTPDGEVVAGYDAYVEVTKNGDGFVALLTNRATGFAVRGGENNEVETGYCIDPATSKPSSQPQHFRATK